MLQPLSYFKVKSFLIFSMCFNGTVLILNPENVQDILKFKWEHLKNSVNKISLICNIKYIN